MHEVTLTSKNQTPYSCR